MHPKLEESKKPDEQTANQAAVPEKDMFWFTLHQTIISNPQYQKRLAKRKSDYEKRKKAEATGEYFEIEGDGKYDNQ